MVVANNYPGYSSKSCVCGPNGWLWLFLANQDLWHNLGSDRERGKEERGFSLASSWEDLLLVDKKRYDSATFRGILKPC